ncbi:MAG TPA: protein kinase, partial [Tepidisphaeraceae bacterium]|nr:protein kinase [Tepidisphaeraceae bacterium]
MAAVNQRISEYILEKSLGRGTFGEVWRARHHVWADQLVAIKIPSDPAYIRNLQREGTAIHGLEHPNIVRALGFDPYSDPPYLVMEYVPGTSLRPLVESRSLTPEDAVAILRQVLSGLSHAHSHGLVHRDIKPENILIHERAAKEGYNTPGVVKVTDFGLGKAATTVQAESIAFSASMGAEDAKRIAGTLDYMAPEQRNGDGVDARADLYACGVILYELLTGERPAGTEVPSELNKASPPYLDEVFRRSYARLEKRYASADEFLAALTVPVNAPPPLPPPLPWERPASASRVDARNPLCPSCRRPVAANDQFCMHCGLQLVEWGLRPQLQNLVQLLPVHLLRHRVIFDPLADARHIRIGHIQPAQRPPLLAVLLDHPQPADGHELFAAQVQLAGRHQLFLRLHLKLQSQRLPQLRGLLRRPLLENLLLVHPDLFDLLEQPIPLLFQQNLLPPQLLPIQLAKRLLGPEDFVDEGHGCLRSIQA